MHIDNMNADQQRAFDRVAAGHSVLLCGAAGTGKSFTIKHIVEWARLSGKYIGVTATTGSAAILIGGSTVHSFLGIGLGTKSAEELANEIKTKKRFVYQRLQRLCALIIDEISMMDSKLFDLISQVLCIIRNDKRPFGNVQLVLCGDLFQLPPVKFSYMFKSNIWPSLDIEMVELTESMRHKDDVEFLNMLQQLRWGKCPPDVLKKLKSTSTRTWDDGIEPTVLYSKNIDVDITNDFKYQELIATGARCFTYRTEYSGQMAQTWATSCKVPESCSLCVGAQVVLTWNIDVSNGLCNGARGVVTDVGMMGVTVKFASGVTIMISHIDIEHEDDKKIRVNFMPLKLAYALTMNKSQGMTLDRAIVVLEYFGNAAFMYGRAYTALSRVRNLNSIQVLNASSDCFAVHPDVIEFYKNT